VDHARVLETVTGFLHREGFRYAVVGAFALHAYGLSRATFDLDFATEDRAQSPLVGFLESLGYETLHRSAGYSSHLHREAASGRVDVVYVTGETARQLFDGARASPALGGHPVPRAEHLVAMKVHAMTNDPARTLRELADIEFLMRQPGIDEAEIRGYFERAGLRARYDELKRLP
jgi:hypothetical protein